MHIINTFILFLSLMLLHNIKKKLNTGNRISSKSLSVKIQ